MNGFRRFFLTLGGLAALASPLAGYKLDEGPYWPDGTVTLKLKLGASPTYQDGTTPDGTAVEAAKAWNPYMGRMQLATATSGAGAGGSHNSSNEVFFGRDVYGSAFGSDVLAVTVIWTTSTRRTETDVVVNQAETWNAYRGSLRSDATDLRRVLIHEFGHVLGLDHTDGYPSSIMYPYIGNIELPTTDDQNGVASLYGNGTANPPIPPHIPSNMPYDATVTEGQGVSFYVSLNWDDTPPFQYQWKKDGVDLPGATGERYEIASTTLADAGLYSVVVTNAGGTATSRGAKLTVNPAQPPQLNSYSLPDVTGTVGKYASFYASISSGSAPFTYQWRKDGVAIAGATDSTLSFNSLVLTDAGLYSVVVANRAGSATSREARLTVNPPSLPTVSFSSTSQNVYLGGSVNLSANVSGGTDPFSYQWEKDGVAIPGSVYSYLSVSNVTAAQAGVYTLVVTNPAGSIRSSNGVTLVIQPKPLPPETTISAYNAAYSLQCSLTYDDGSSGPFTYQWHRNGAAIVDATASSYTIPVAQRSEAADYIVVVGNPAGISASRTFSYVPPSPSPGTATGGWIAAERLGDIAYFLFANPARIERYDLAQSAWLPALSLPRTPTSFRPDPSGLFVGFGKSVSRFNTDGTGETAILTVDQDIAALFVRSGILYVFYPQTYVYAQFKSVRLSDNVVLDTKSYTYAMTKPGSLSFAPGLGKIFGRDSGLSPADIHVVDVNADGTFAGEKDSPYHGDYADATRTFVSPDEKLVFEDCGTIYYAADLTFAGALGVAWDDLTFASDGSPLVLSGGRLLAYDARHAEAGQLTLSGAPTRIFARGQTVTTFEPPSGAGTSTTVRQVKLDQLKARTSWPRVSAEGLSYAPSEIICGADEVVYLLSRAHGNVFRWSIGQGRYLESLPLQGAPDYLTASADASTIYAAYANKRITKLTVASGTEQPFYTAASPIIGFTMAGDYVFFNDATSPWTSYYTLDAGGNLIARRSWSEQSRSFIWNATKRRLYHFRDGTSPNDLIYTEVKADGSFGDNKDSPYHGEISTRYPIRVSPDGGNVLLGSGIFFDADTLKQNNALPVGIDDAVWLGSRLYTARDMLAGVRLERWGGNNYGLDATGMLTGRLLRLFALPDNRLLVVLMRNNIPAFVVVDADLNGTNPLPPQITSQPGSVTVAAGAATTLSASVSGGSLRYQWQKDGIDLPGANAAALSLAHVGTADVGSYTLVARNAAGVALSSTVRVALSNFAFAGSSFGSFLGGAGEFALVVGADGSTALIGGLTASQQAIVATGLDFAADGSFTWSPPAGGLRGTTADAVRYFTGAISGRIANGTLSLAIPSLQLTATAVFGPASSAVEEFGFYQGMPLARSTGELFVARGVDGRAFVLEVGAGSIRNTIVSVSVGGALTVTLGAGSATPTGYVGTLAAGGFRGTATPSTGAAVTLVPPPALPGHQRLANISSRGVAGAGEKVLTAGFVVTGTDPKDVLIRAVGPTLANLGVSGTLANPSITLYRGSTPVLTNDDWGSAPSEISTAASRLGAFALVSGSRDSALFVHLAPGLYTTQVGLNNGNPGVAMIEVYDAGTSDSIAPKVVNISTRADVGRGDNILIAGFVVNGDAPKKILLRGVGPGLTALGVNGALVDPQIKLFAGSTQLAQNDNWSDGENRDLIAAAASQVGAFGLPAGSKDAAMLLYLLPGLYSVHLGGVGEGTGIGMVEVYEVTD